jgi:hypothetical protein
MKLKPGFKVCFSNATCTATAWELVKGMDVLDYLNSRG